MTTIYILLVLAFLFILATTGKVKQLDEKQKTLDLILIEHTRKSSINGQTVNAFIHIFTENGGAEMRELFKFWYKENEDKLITPHMIADWFIDYAAHKYTEEYGNKE